MIASFLIDGISYPIIVNQFSVRMKREDDNSSSNSDYVSYSNSDYVCGKNDREAWRKYDPSESHINAHWHLEIPFFPITNDIFDINDIFYNIYFCQSLDKLLKGDKKIRLSSSWHPEILITEINNKTTFDEKFDSKIVLEGFGIIEV